MVVLTLVAGCWEQRGGCLGKGGSSIWSWDWGQDPSMPALWRHVFPLHSALGQVPLWFKILSIPRGSKTRPVSMQMSVENLLSSTTKLKPLWLFVLDRAECCVIGGGSCWQRRCEVLWLLGVWHCTLPSWGDFSPRKMRDFSLVVSSSHAIVAALWCSLCWLKVLCAACQAALALGRVPQLRCPVLIFFSISACLA